MMSDGNRPSEIEEGALRAGASPRSLGGRTIFGAVVGLLAGAAAGWASCWLIDETTVADIAGAVGAFLGFFGGGAIALIQSRRFPESINPDIGTFVCIAYAILPAVLTLLGTIGAVHGKRTGFLAVGTAFAFPAGAALIGGLLDRIAEAVFRGRSGPTSG